MSDLKVFNPYSNDVVGEVSLSSKEELRTVVKRAKEAELTMEALSSYEKQSILNNIAEGIALRANEFIACIIKESGKPFKYAKGEVERAIATFRLAGECSTRLPHELIDLDRTERGDYLKGEYVYFPVGLTLGISPFNFPLNLAVHKIAPAIAAGCPIVLKPSSKTPLTMELLNEVIQESGLPDSGFTCVHCTREVGDFLIQSDDFKLISFTGSPEVGWHVKKRAGKKKVVLELGGNAAAILAEDTSVEKAIKDMLVGGFAYSGQVCIHTQRIYVHETLYNKFLAKYIEQLETLKIGNPQEEKTDFSVMIDETNAIRVEEWVNEALNQGAKLICGGKREGTLYYPTVLTNVPKGMKVLEEEVFGPVVIIETFKEISEAIQAVNQSRWGLQASIYTDKISVRDRVFRELKVGALVHNLPTTFRVDEMPYGGIKDSGFGREGVKYAMLDYLEGKLLVRKG